jgi:glucose-6-phosphate-specific signal transduction histidine kinase
MKLRRPSPTLLWWFAAGTLGVAVLVVSAPIAASEYDVPLFVAFIAATAQGAALPLTLSRPIEATVLQFAGVVTVALAMPVNPDVTWPLTIPGLVALSLHIGLVGMRYSWRAATVTWWASVLLCILVAVLDPRGPGIDQADVTLIVYATDSALVLIAAMVIRHWSGIRRQLAEARRDIAVEQSQRAVAEERTRIARELHDVVAHSMSVIHMQATSASYRLKNADEESKAEFTRIAAGARSAMREMRQLLSVLRDEQADVSLAPVPGLERVPELAESTRQAGVPVTLRMGTVPEVPDTVATAAYRIVQESLSNVIRHAPGARTLVIVDFDLDAGMVDLSVCNDAAEKPPEESSPGGHGLHGMRERVRLVGGTLETGPREEGGYRVTARLPLRVLPGGSAA